jgi:glutathione S-transferase
MSLTNISEYAINRFTTETNRLYSVVETQLAKQPYISGESFGIADIKGFGWMKFAEMTGIELQPYPNIKKWLEKIEARPGVKAGLDKAKGN